MYPTPNPTIAAGINEIGRQYVQESVIPLLMFSLVAMLVMLVVLGGITWLVYRNKQAIKRFLNL